MKRSVTLIIVLLCFFSVSVWAQTKRDSIIPVDTALLNIYKQMMIFPQEKIYIQTDKPYYTAGETVFYRLFLLGACFHVPFPLSRYVYVELIDQNNSVEFRQKLRPDEKGLYYNTFKLSEHLAQGYYKIRAYTRLMENQGTEYFYSKPVYVITENDEHLKMEMNVSVTDNKHTSAELRFVDARTGVMTTPEDVFLQLNGKRQKKSHKNSDGVFEFELPLTNNDTERNLYVEVMDNNDSVIFKQFDVVPYTSDSIDLSFYPEGGYVVEGQPNIITFKALGKDGAPVEITGAIFDADGTTTVELSTKHEGMGVFCLTPEKGKICFVEYESGNKRYRMQLPDFKRNKFSLHTTWRNDKLWITANKETDAILPNMYLLAHCRGDITYFNRWDNNQNTLSLPKELLRSGITHLILLSEDYYPLSERLVFCNKNDHITPGIKPDKKEYRNRERAVMDISLYSTESIEEAFDLEDSTTYEKNGIKYINLPEVVIKGKRTGRKSKNNFRPSLSVSVTADKYIQIDTTTNILTQILLESELKGTISNPAYYFSNAPRAESDADMLMMTHGWTRYDIPKAMRGEFSVPLKEPEVFQSLTGTVKSGLIPRAAPDVEVSVMSHQGKEKYYNITRTDKNGLFRFDFELPDSSSFVVQALKKHRPKGLIEVIMDTVEYPVTGDFGFPQYYLKATSPFIEKTITDLDWKYDYIDGIRVIRLPEVTVIGRWADKKPKYRNFYGITPDFIITQKEIEKSGIKDVLTLISKLPYVTVNFRGWNSTVEVESLGVSGEKKPAVIIVNGIQQRREDSPAVILSLVNVSNIVEIHLINSTYKTADITLLEVETTSDGKVLPTPCIIEIMTKDGKLYDRRPRFHLKTLTPLGYAVPAEFYSPKYNTSKALKNENLDLRTTIYWKPNIVVDRNNKASVNFYTADTPTTYSVVIEGVSPYGRLIYRREKEIVKVK